MFRTVNPTRIKIKNTIIIILSIVLILFILYLLYRNNKDFFKTSTDSTAPIVKSINISTDNSNSKEAVEGDTISLRITFNEELRDKPRVMINNREVDVYKRNGYYDAYYNVLESPKEDTIVSYKIYSYYDLSGNSGSTIDKKSDIKILGR